MRKSFSIVAIITGALLSTVVFAVDSRLVAWWKFDEGEGKIAFDCVTQKEDGIWGNSWYLPGVSLTSVKFDGFTTRIVRKAADAPRLQDSFTVMAWVAPQAYPYNWCAIVNQERDHRAGYFFGIDDFGRVGLHLAIDGKWHECTSEETIPFMTKWCHIAGTFSKEEGIAVYIDGKIAASLPVKGELTFAADMDLQIGRNHEKTRMNPEALVRRGVNFPTSYSFDGIIDELKIYDRALSADEIRQAYENSDPKSAPPLKWRKLPELPKGSGEFGAIYCKLKFYPEWDALWRVSDHPDIVVNFDGNPYQMVFWRGTNYNMNLVTENGKWVADQSAEGGGGNVTGCCEHMSDKQCRYAHVRLTENNDARVVVHWRYAVCDVLYRIANLHDGWGAWADEYYYIYPDGVAVRAFNVYGLGGGCSITEPASLNNPGERAEDNLHIDAIVTANMNGQIRAHRWDPWPSSGRVAAPFTNPLPDANISVVNFKSQSKPFYIYEPGTRIIPYGGGLREVRDYSRFPTWNHWPVSQAPSDGRYAFAADRVSSSAVTSPEPPMIRRRDGAVVGRFIMGLSNQPIEKLAPIARSWLQAPEIRVRGTAFTSEGYNRDQRAFVLRANHPDGAATLEMNIAASEKSPAVNPAFVVKGWGDAGAALTLNGQPVSRGRDFRFDHRHTLEGADLIVWINMEAMEPVRVAFQPVKE